MSMNVFMGICTAHGNGIRVSREHNHWQCGVCALSSAEDATIPLQQWLDTMLTRCVSCAWKVDRRGKRVTYIIWFQSWHVLSTDYTDGHVKLSR